MSRRYKVPNHVNVRQLRKQADARRRVLRQAGLRTYEIGRRAGAVGIVCLCCGLGSAHPQDVRQRYCGFCNAFHDDVPEEQAREP
ncbi:MAG: hypothetical protein ACOCXI_08920 [Chloroflexota bacterium]